MATGSFNISRTSGSSYLTFRVDWSSTAKGSSANSSDVRVKVYVIKSSSSTAATFGSANTTVKVGSASLSNNGLSFSVSPGSSVLLFDKTFSNIKHNEDGSKSVTISATVGGNVMGAKGSKTVTLDKIARKAEITSAPNFTDEENPILKYKNDAGNAVSTLQACISFTGSKADIPYRDISKTGTSYTFNLTEDERNILRNGTTTSNSRNVYFYIKTILDGETYYTKIAKTLTIVNATPTITPVVEDISAEALYLTQDKNKFIKYISDAAFTMNAAAYKGATITSRKVVCGKQSATTDTGTFNDVESASFTFTAMDSRGNTVSQTVNKTLINYDFLTCGLEATAPTTDGVATLKVRGKYYNGSLGAQNNTLIILYRYKVNSEEYGEWTAAEATPTYEGNIYEAEFNVSGLNYLNTYTFQARVADLIDTEDSIERKVKTVPIFDWSEEDFTTEVPLRAHSGIQLDAAGEQDRLNGVTDYTDALQYYINPNGALMGMYLGDPKSSNDISERKNWLTIVGNPVTFISDKVQVNGLGSITGMLKAMSNSYELDVTTTAGANYSIGNATAYLVGNNLRLYFSATRNSAATGNIGNEKVLTFTINSGGKIKGALNVGFSSASSGPSATFYTTTSMDGNLLKVDITLAAIGTGNLTETNAYFTLPATIDTTKY